MFNISSIFAFGVFVCVCVLANTNYQVDHNMYLFYVWDYQRIDEICPFGNPVFRQHFYQWENKVSLSYLWYSNLVYIILKMKMITFKSNFVVTWVYLQSIRVNLFKGSINIYRSWYTLLQNLSVVALLNKSLMLLFSHLCVWVNRITFNNFPFS